MKRSAGNVLVTANFRGVVFALLICLFPVTVLSYMYGGTVPIIEDVYLPLEQTSPDIIFNDMGYLQAVWRDVRPPDAFAHIYHRFGTGGVFIGSSVPVDTETVDNGLDYPRIGSRGTMPGFLDVIVSRNNPNYLSIYEYDGNWMELLGYPLPLNPTQDYAVTTYADHVYFAYIHEFNNKITIAHFDGGWSDVFDIESVSTETFANVDLCTDAEGFIYIAYDFIDAQSYGIARRSINKVTVGGGFTWERQINEPNLVNSPTDPAICAVGSFAVGDLMVGIGYEYGFLSPPVDVRCIVEANIDWQGATWHLWQSGSAVIHQVTNALPFEPENIDAVFARNDELHLAWATLDITGVNKVYAAMTYEPMTLPSFYPIQLISRPGTHESISPTHPRLAAFASDEQLAIAFEEWNFGLDNVWAVWNLAGFGDECDDPGFPGWSAHTGVEVYTNPPDRPANPAYRFMISKDRGGTLEMNYPQQMAGSLDFWFYDPFGQPGAEDPQENFWVQLYGDNGADADVYRMVGVRNNITDATTYFLGINTAWVDTTRPRGQGWHHVIVETVHQGPETGIHMYLDPESSPAKINSISLDPNYAEFTSFSNIQFISTALQVEYFVDDISILAEPVGGGIDVPSASPLFIGILLAAFIFILGIRSR
ncbi:hypothetical protein JXA40_01100 [bacterium]|nr:hypothetical protein [candidate division CSSED10-310 bacterium]